MYATTLEGFVGRDTSPSKVCIRSTTSERSEEGIVQSYKPSPQPHTRPQSHIEHQLWDTGVELRGMRHSAMSGYLAAKQLVEVSVVGERLIIPAFTDDMCAKEREFYCGLAIGVRHFMQADESATGVE